MDADGFKKWLIENKVCKSTKLVIDCVSRAQRVEKAFQAEKPRFSFDREYAKDKGVSFMKSISRRGIALEIPVALPIGTNQMDSITSAAKKYFLFLKSSEEA